MSERIEFRKEGAPLQPEPLHYRACGLDTVFLLNGFSVEDDPELGELVTIDDERGLWNAIALHIVEQERPMTGAEVRFLRKLMRLTQAELADRLRVDAQTVANYEKGRGMPETSDVLLRLVALLDILPADTQAGALRGVVSGSPPQAHRRSLPASDRGRIARSWRETPATAA